MPRLLLAALFLVPVAFADSPAPRTAAEISSYKKTSTNAEVVQFCEALAKQFPDTVKYSTYGKSHEGQPLALLTIADASETPKPAVLAYANIHAGEVDGKEALLMLARDLAGDDGKSLREKLTILIAPNINPDGNDKVSDKNRTEQNGPPGVGTRANAQGFDLNRDFVKLESPEIRALVKLFTDRDPLLIIDCHTTNGSHHRYKLTYDGPRYAAADSALIQFSQSKVLPAVAAGVKEKTGFDTLIYGNFSRDGTKWETYAGTPRFGTQCIALRNRIGLLSESYSYASFEERVQASEAFVRSAFEFAAENLKEIQKCVQSADKEKPSVVLKTKLVDFSKPISVLAYDSDGKTPKEFTLAFAGQSEASADVERPAAYLIPKKYESAIQNLQRHGIKVEEIREDLHDFPVEVYTVNTAERAQRPFQKHQLMKVEAAKQAGKRSLAAGDFIVRTNQPLGQLACYLLEPNAEDGLAVWNFFDDGLKASGEYPVLRLLSDAITSEVAQVPPEERKEKKAITPELLFGGRGFGGFARGVGGNVTWLPDGEHWLESKGNMLQKVNALTGKAEPAFDAAAFRKSLESIKGLDRRQLDGLARGAGLRTDRDRTGALIDAGGQVWFAYFDGKDAVQVTKTDMPREYVSLSPAGTDIAFVSKGNLFTVNINSQKETQLTTDGGKNDILNGKGDWVYFEEIFNRNGQAYWWSPDGKAIAFLRFDDTPVRKFTIAKAYPARGDAEVYAYPKPGDPNPTVKLFTATLEGKVTELPLGDRKPEDTIVSRVGWTKSGDVYAYVQNRIQSWLDFTVWKNGEPKVLFRDKTKAWIDDAGEPKFLADGSFLFPSERDGFKHLYHYKADGTLIRQVTKGDWEVTTVHRVDEKNGWVYVSGTHGSPNGSNFVRASLETEKIEPLTNGKGTHSVSVAPAGDLFVDRFSDPETPTRSLLKRFDGKEERKLDTNPGNELSEYKFGKFERVQIPVDGDFTLEGSIVYPPDFDAKKKYPIWIMTYAGPHSPTIRDSWGGGRIFENVLATMGVVVFRVDPRSASGKSMESAWICYRKLGVPELKDLEAAADWICKNDWADKSRVGLSGHSYGGFITAYALTHSKKFSAGIAGAPVTDWRLYDSIYTERYMGLPSDNEKGYDETSCVKAAKNLHGKLLIIHGLIDDNVHMQNTMQFAHALQQANKPFELMIYPQSRHGIGGRHYQELQIDFIKRTMLK